MICRGADIPTRAERAFSTEAQHESSIPAQRAKPRPGTPSFTTLVVPAYELQGLPPDGFANAPMRP
jgi:hypothetical protein